MAVWWPKSRTQKVQHISYQSQPLNTISNQFHRHSTFTNHFLVSSLVFKITIFHETSSFLLLLPIALRPFQFGLGFPYNFCPFFSVHCFRSPSLHTKLLMLSSTSFIHLGLPWDFLTLIPQALRFFLTIATSLADHSLPNTQVAQLLFLWS